ncbi:unnamed protein product [Xylocopa violacea]|uniref:Dynein regulatory complex protein 9 n=1 Tax=Xylocopa violacea TaxID=135666 RepID=A0ABP1PHX0_XYLVO
MTMLAANSSSRFPAAERPTILATLDEFTNALAIYHNTLKKHTQHDNDILDDCLLFDVNDLEVSSPEEITRMKEAKERTIARKIYENSLYMTKIMEELKEEIREQGTFEILTKEIEKIVLREKEEKALLLEQERLTKTVVQLQKIIAEEKVANEQSKKRILNELSEEQCNIEKVKLIADAELEYVTEWEKARYEQNSLRRDMEIEKLEKILNVQRMREKNEQRIYDELTRFLLQETAMLEKKTKEWEKRYDSEKQMYEKEIQHLHSEIKTRRKEFDELKEEYRCNQEFIDMYLAEKEAVRSEMEQRERMQKSAIKIQAWWRGVMVRRKLGPYRPAEKKKKRQTKAKK